MIMWTFGVLLIICCFCNLVNTSDANKDPILYYYGLEESERSLPACSARQACSALLLRHWRAPALLRLCRCERRQRCDIRVPEDRLIELNNRAHFQFCHPVTDWPECTSQDTPLIVETTNNIMNPDEIEEFHHKNLQLEPPKVTFNCRCRTPNYWKLNKTAYTETTQKYQCYPPPPCKTGEFCGNVNYDLNSLYQSCLCPKHHMCVHNGGITNHYISELLYRGKGWKAYCRRINDDYSYEDD